MTNFFEFRLYRNGVLWSRPVKIFDFSPAKNPPQFPVVQNEEEFKKLLSYFFDFVQPSIKHSRTLAAILAYKASIMRDYVVLPTMQENEENYFFWLYKSFKEHLIKDLKEQDFADLFSQTFVYGLVIAKYDFEAQQTLFGKKNSDLPFTTQTAYNFIQKNFGLLREIFKVISTQDMPKSLEIIVDDIVHILNNTEIYRILSQTGNSGKKDPIFHLYETFLLHYDKEKKIKLGVFYTPLEVVSYIVNSIHTLLKDEKLFDAPDGLASYKTDSIEKSVTLLDPAVGTGTFFVNAIEKAVEEAKSKYSYSPNYISDLIRKHILPHFFAFEILIAPYVVSYLKVLFSLRKEGFEFTDTDNDKPLKIFLTNTLEFHRKETTGFPGFIEQTLVKEHKNALEVKNNTPILIVMGNPPYSVSSQNEVDTQTQFGRFYESYKENVRKEEKIIQPLSDDYIKFLAFAHWKVKQTGKGIVGMITNNSYLDGLIHRDMRKKILEDFDLIYILNLHGDAKRPKTNKDGKKDENVFDIRQGVAISLLVKSEKPTKKQVYYQELIGSRESKYNYLDTYDVKSSSWQELKPKEPYWFFVPKEFEEEEKYKSFYSVKDIFNKHIRGVVTSRDDFVIAESKIKLANRLSSFIDFDLSLDLLKESFQLKDTKKWKVKIAQELLQKKGFNENVIYQYSYRPFDKRWVYYDDILLERSRSSLMINMIQPNIALVLMRQVYWNNYSHFFITSDITDSRIFISRRGAADIFPLWLYNSDNKTQNQLLFTTKAEPKTPNIKKEVIDLLSSSYKNPVSPEEIFYYIYAVLYSNIYRQKYLEFLKIDFPKIPFTSEYELFKKFSELGKELTDLHLLKNPLLNNTSSRFEGKNDGFVKNPRYNERERKIYINDNQYFTNVLPEIWNYYIGGYQVLLKWLKDRKDKPLSSEEVNHYIRIIEAIRQTIKIQEEIDTYYPQVEKNLIILN